MKVGFTISQLGGGGAERVVVLLANELSIQGYDTSIITLYKQEIAYDVSPKVNLIDLDCKMGPFYALGQISKLHSCFVSSNFDVIISFLPIVNSLAIIARNGVKSKLIVSERNDPYQNPRKKSVRLIRDFLYHYADGFVFQTPDAKKYFENLSIHNGTVIANPLSNNLPEPYRGTRTNKFVTAVRLEPQKNLDMLIDAFSMFLHSFPSYSLEIYGEGSQRRYLEKKCVDLNLKEKIIFKGFKKNLHENILDSAAFIISSNYEGMSNSLLEALALGIPVISTDHPIGGARMFIQNGINGILTQVGKKEDMLEAMLFAARNPGKMQLMAEEAVKIREQLTIKKITNQWINYINCILVR